jgi:hypothetical protein
MKKKPIVLLLMLLVVQQTLAQVGNEQSVISTNNAVSNASLLKVYVTDAETQKDIKDAKVWLEAPGKPNIPFRCETQGACYVIGAVPEGYTTVMASHPMYNDKGQQVAGGLKGEITLKLYDPLNVSYSFERVKDSIHILATDKYVTTRNYRHLYVEDPYKIGVKVTDDNCSAVIDQILSLCPELEPINPYYEDNKSLDSDSKTFSCRQLKKLTNYTMPLAVGYTSGPLKSKVDYEEVVVFFRFRDGHKFKRFNDACIARLSTLKDIRVFGLVYEKAEYIGKARYRKKFTSELDARNLHAAGQSLSGIALYRGTGFPVYGNNRYFNESSYYGNPNGEPIVKEPEREFYLVPLDGCTSVHNSRDISEDVLIPHHPGTGLGILDQLEVFCSEKQATATVGIFPWSKPCE